MVFELHDLLRTTIGFIVTVCAGTNLMNRLRMQNVYGIKDNAM